MDEKQFWVVFVYLLCQTFIIHKIAYKEPKYEIEISMKANKQNGGNKAGFSPSILRKKHCNDVVDNKECFKIRHFILDYIKSDVLIKQRGEVTCDLQWLSLMEGLQEKRIYDNQHMNVHISMNDWQGYSHPHLTDLLKYHVLLVMQRHGITWQLRQVLQTGNQDWDRF